MLLTRGGSSLSSTTPPINVLRIGADRIWLKLVDRLMDDGLTHCSGTQA